MPPNLGEPEFATPAPRETPPGATGATRSAIGGGQRRPPPRLPFLLVFLAEMGVGLELARPFKTAAIAYDTAASVIHFERMASGRHLEAVLNTTPKPLLTVVDGLLYALTGDWRPIAWATLAAFAAAAAIASYVAARLDGWLAAGLVAVAFGTSGGLWIDAGLSLAVAWALLGLALAALAVTSARPRYGLAGVAILLASLARIESLALVPVAVASLAWASTRNPPSRRPPRAAWLVPLVPTLAIPIMLIHDWILIGDPMYWARIADLYSATTRSPILAPGGMLAALAGHGVHEIGFLILAVVGIVRLARGRSRALAIGLIGLCLGVSALLVLLAARHIYVSDRYFLLIDAALILAAGFGASAIAELLSLAAMRVRSVGIPRIVRPVAAMTLGGLVAIALGWPLASFDPRVRSTLGTHLALSEHFATSLPLIRAALAAPSRQAGVGRQPSVRLSVPLPLLPRAVVDTDLSWLQVGLNAGVEPGSQFPIAGQIVFHDRLGDPRLKVLTAIEVVTPRRVGSVVVRPLRVDRAAGYWLVLGAQAP
ncbi:MAG: hypothetical protein M3Y88_03320 [Chloroflexota bacterium]|nr:hypothetical protein [Chloroflexota bacterium]